MVDQGIPEMLHEIAIKLYARGLIGDLLNAPGNLISQVLSPPAATTVESPREEVTQAPAETTKAAAAPVTTQPPAAAAPSTTPQPAAAAPTSSPKQEQQQPAQTPAPASQSPVTTKAASQQLQKTTAAPVANPPAISSAVPAADAVPTTIANAAAAPTASGVVPVQSKPVAAESTYGVSPSARVSGVTGADATKSGGGSTSTTQTPTSPNLEPQTNETNSQTPLVATGVVLGIVVLMGISLLFYWCYRRRRKANMHHHAALPPESPSDEFGPAPRFPDAAGQNAPQMTENRAVSGADQLMVQHSLPGQDIEAQSQQQTSGSGPERSNPYSASPFTYAQAQQYAQSHGFSYPVPPIPEPSPIRIFRWPTRSSRSGSSAPSVFSGWRTSKALSRAQSRASRSTMSSMLWHGRRDVIARRTMNQTPPAQRNGFLSANGPDSPMHDGLHTPILDWLHWIRGHQSDNGDPEANHRKSFASTTESSISEGTRSIASSGVFSPTLLSWPPPAEGQPPHIDPEALEALRFLPMPLQLKRQSSNGDTIVEPSGSRIVSFQ